MVDAPKKQPIEEEEVNLAGPASAVKGEEEADKVMTDHKEIDLSGKVEGITTAEELLDSLIKMPEDEFIPWEEITLPSHGVYYGDKVPGGIIRVRGMGIAADKILATQRLAASGQSLDYLFEHCTDLPDGFEQSELLTGDRIFLLYYIRGITHGNEYEFALTCPNCDTQSAHIYNLNELADTIRYADPSLGDEPFKVVLPYLSKALGGEVWVKVRFMRGSDVSHIASQQRFKKRVRAGTARRDRRIAIDEAVSENLLLVIEGMGGANFKGEVKNKARIKQLFDQNKIHSRDSATIRQFLTNKSPGIDTTIMVECPECSNRAKTELPITEAFFRPTSEGEAG